MGKKYLLFGAARDCRTFASEKGLELDDYKIIKRESDFLGYSNVELVYLGGPHTVDEYALYHEARRYFIAKGEITED